MSKINDLSRDPELSASDLFFCGIFVVVWKEDC